MVLVTGGTGLLGIHLILHLHQQGITPRAIYRSAIPDVVQNKAQWFKADLLDVIALEQAMEGITEVYHCAGFVSFDPADKKMLHQVNIDGTANIVNACLDAGVRKLVHVSSVAALGRIRPGERINETMSWTEETSNSIYGKTKYLGEMEVWRGIGEGLTAVMVNPTIILGEHADWNTGSMKLFSTVYKGFPWFSTGSTGFADAADIARIMVLLMQSDVQKQRFIISAENITYRDYMFAIADSFGRPRPHKKVTPFLAALVWRLEKVKSWFTRKKPLITKETANTGLAEVRYDNSKLLRALPGFTYTPLKTSIERIAQHLKQKHNL